MLAQLAHNLLVWFKRWFLWGTKVAGPRRRLVDMVLAIPAQVRMERWVKDAAFASDPPLGKCHCEPVKTALPKKQMAGFGLHRLYRSKTAP